MPNKQKDNSNTNLPTDGFFKGIMKQELAAKEFLEIYLPKQLKALVDLSKITIEKESFVEDNLKRKLSDVIYSLPTNDGSLAYVYTIIEHQSSPDYWISFRLLKYTLLLLERHLDKKDKLPLVYSMVIYNGKVKYTAPKNLWELFIDPKLAKELITEDYRLIDLQAMPDEEIKNHAHIGMVEYILKHIHQRDLLKLLDEFFKNFKLEMQIEEKHDYIYLKPILWYIEKKLEESKQPRLEATLRQHFTSQAGENFMRTIAQKYIEEGEARGREEGREEGMAKFIKMMIKNGNSVASIAKSAGISESEVQKLASL